ncbi:MAG: glycoside hydrolase family 127 protein [Lentisphaeria bacterium]|nr:glycoside hydrolase family 127 protein [Lentisphaeria bacterium]
MDIGRVGGMGFVVHGGVGMGTVSGRGWVHRSPHLRVHPLPMGAARWESGFWRERFDLCRSSVLPGMREALLDPGNAARLSNFRVGAGLDSGGHVGVNWSDGDCYKWLEALAHVYALTREDALDAEMDEWIGLIARTQADDGYINTQIQLNPRKERWTQRANHELYNHGHLMTAACVHHAATGKQTFLRVAVRLADYLYGVFGPRPAELAHFGWNPSNIMGLVDLYRATGEGRYLELAGIFVDMRGSRPWASGQWGRVWADDPNPGDQNQDRVPLRQETEAVGHAVTAAYLYCGATDVAAETGEPELIQALERLWRNVTRRKLYLTGAIGAYHHGVSSRFDMVHEAFGREYELPSATAYNETCANIGNAMWARRLLALTGRAEFADEMERVLYNSALSPMDLDGRRFCYCNPLARLGPEAPLLNHDTPERWRIHTCYCCPPQVARTLASLQEWAFGWDPTGLWLHLYGAGRVGLDLPDAGRLALTVETDYPWEGTVRIRVDEAPETECALHLRVPAWCAGAALACNEVPRAAPVPGQYAILRRAWRPGDTVTLELPLRVRLLVSHPNVEETRNQAAVMRGPLVYCLEAVDLPAAVPIHEVFLPRDAEWSARHDPALLGGVTVLETTACRRPGPDWTDRLYAELPEGPCESLSLRLVPYYAWLNRGNHPMRVWLPLA